MRDQPADGVEIILRQVHAEGRVDVGYAHVAGHTLVAVGQRDDAVLALGLVEFVLDLADDLLQHVLDGDQPGRAAEFVDHDRQVVAVGSEVAQQVVQRLALGHEDRRPQQRAQVQLGRALQLQQVLAIRMPMMLSRSPS